MPKRMPPIAPTQAAVQTLQNEAVQAGFSEECVRDKAWLLNAYCHLTEFPRIAENLLQMLELIPATWNISLEEIELASWPSLLRWMGEHRQELAKTISAFSACPDTPPHQSNPLRGECAKRNPLYTSLWERHADSSRQVRYCLLQAHLLVAHVLAMRQYSTRDGYERYAGKAEWRVLPNSVYPASKALRAFGRSRYSAFLDHCPVEQPPEEFVGQFAALSPPDDSRLIGYHQVLSRFLQYVALKKWRPRDVPHEGSEPTHRSGNGPRRRVESSNTQALGPEDREELNDGRVAVTRLTECPLSKAEEKEQLETDLCPGEEDLENLVFCRFDQDEAEEDAQGEEHDRSPARRRDPADSLEIAKAQVKHVAAANQLLPWARTALSPHELSDLVASCASWLRNLPDEGELSPADLDRLEEMALLQVMLFTGSSLPQARQLRVFPAGTRNRDVPLALFCDEQTGHIPHWRVRALRPPYQAEQAEVPGKQHELVGFLSLPDVAGGSSFLLRFRRERQRLRSLPGNGAHSPHRASHGGALHERDYHRRLQQLLQELDPTGNLTLPKISNWLFRAVVTATGGDVAVASLITGKRHYLARVRGFYACYSLARLQRVYVQVVSEAAAQIRATIGANSVPPGLCPPPGEIHFAERHHYVGCRLAPTPSAVREAISGLLSVLKTAAQYRDLTGWIRYHNLYTLYSIWSFGFASGVRGILSPYLSPAQIHTPSGFASLTDKGKANGYKTRLLWLPPAVLEQMRYYEDHLAVVRSEVQEHTAALDNPCFFLNAEKRAVEVAPKTLRTHMDPFLPFPVNVHRRFIRSELLERNCSPEVVDAWMGHWHRGEEPWGEFSSFSPVRYREALEEYLVPLLRELGFRPLRSCFV